jgi:hypothetical protein
MSLNLRCPSGRAKPSKAAAVWGVIAAAAAGLALALPAHAASEQESLLELKNTVVNLLDALVEQGVLTREKADALMRSAEKKASADAAARRRDAPRSAAAEGRRGTPSDVRVQYVPEFIKDEIREQVRAELREDVSRDVMEKAKQEQWGTPGALPEWVSRFKFSGDLRLRGQADQFAEKNDLAETQPFLYPDFLAINDNGGYDYENPESSELNTTEDRNRLRGRLRLGVDATISSNLKAGVRLSSGNLEDPVSTNQTLGNYGNRWDVTLDRAYLQWNGIDADGYKWLTAWGGRFANPWLGTDLVWDEDLSFEGVVATYRHNLAGGEDLFDLTPRDRTLFVTAGAFPLQEIERSSQDKWMFGAQVGADLLLENQDRLRLGLGYFDYRHVAGKLNPRPALGDPVAYNRQHDDTAPTFLQKGNALFDIRADRPDALTDPLGVGSTRYALAGDYTLLNLTASYDYAALAPTHVVLTADYVKNLGFDLGEVRRRVAGSDSVAQSGSIFLGRGGLGDNDSGYQLSLAVGWPDVTQKGNWRFTGSYRYLESDAVLDAFTDSDFHLGGTDAKGWVLGYERGLAENTWLRFRWLSSDEIDGPPLGVDSIQLDLNARF